MKQIACFCLKCGKEDVAQVETKDYVFFENRGQYAQNAFPYIEKDLQYMLDFCLCRRCYRKELAKDESDSDNKTSDGGSE